eukprot:scaffold726_cov262-Pinguiococcus_pyrenoidosus.AAC.19
MSPAGAGVRQVLRELISEGTSVQARQDRPLSTMKRLRWVHSCDDASLLVLKILGGLHGETSQGSTRRRRDRDP